MMHVVKFVHFCIIIPYFWGIQTQVKAGRHSMLFCSPVLFGGDHRGSSYQMNVRGSRQGKQLGKQVEDSWRRSEQRSGPPEEPVGMSKVEPSMGTDSCQGTASFAISYSFSIWLQDNFIDKVLDKLQGFFLSLSGFHPYKVKKKINHG